MLSNFIIFRIYLLFAIIILLPICYFVTVELFNQIIYYLIVFKNVSGMQEERAIADDLYFLINYLAKRQQWFKCILMLQFYSTYKNYNTDKLLGMCFHNLSYPFLARYCYIKYLETETDLEVLKNLKAICKDLKDDRMLSEICSKIKEIDLSNNASLQ